jgi:hypothetical protein
MMRQFTLFATVLMIVACDRPPPVLVKRAQSSDGSREIALWHQPGASILDSSMLLTIGAPGAKYDPDKVKAGIKRGRHIEAFWARDGKPMLLAQDFGGWLNSENGGISFYLCQLRVLDCKRMFAPDVGSAAIRLGTYTSGESQPFDQ